MFTGYKTRAWWMLRAFDCFEPISSLEDRLADDPKTPLPTRHDRFATDTQWRIWMVEGQRCAAAAMAPAGDDRLTPMYVDRSGNQL